MNKFRSINLKRLKVGESCIVGPYKNPRTVSGKISLVRREHPNRMFVQRQVILSDVTNGTCQKIYIVTREK